MCPLDVPDQLADSGIPGIFENIVLSVITSVRVIRCRQKFERTCLKRD